MVGWNHSLPQKRAAGFFGDCLLHREPGKIGHGGFALVGIGQGGEVGRLAGGRFPEGDFPAGARPPRP